MSLFAKFNLILLAVFTAALVPAAFFARSAMERNAQQQVLENAGILMQTALATRTYTSKQISPLLRPMLEENFIPQSVPAYSATEIFNYVRESHPEYSYKEATLNPAVFPKGDYDYRLFTAYETTDAASTAGWRT